MPRKLAGLNAAVALDLWPTKDRALWDEAFSDDAYESPSRRITWHPNSIRINRNGYGRWLAFLTRSGIEIEPEPADRVTPDRVRSYMLASKQLGLSTRTRCNVVAQLLSVITVLAPKGDWGWLRRCYNRLNALAKAERSPTPPAILTDDILGKALKAMTHAQRGSKIEGVYAAIEYRNWLSVTMLTLTPLRLGNFFDLRLKNNFRRVNGELLIEIEASKTKNHKPISMPVPDVLDKALAFYLAKVRPVLFAANDSDHLWITISHGPITYNGMHVAIRNFTLQKFGMAISPHAFRSIAATSAAIAAPDQMEMARALLGHSDLKMTQEYYILAPSLGSSRRQAALVANLRQRLST